MYIKTNENTYPCGGFYPSVGEVRFRLDGDDLPETLGETVELCQDDGFVMAAVTVADYERWEIAGNTLVLTNRPVPEPVHDPELIEEEPPTPTVQDAMLDMLADLAYRVDSMELAAMASGNNV